MLDNSLKNIRSQDTLLINFQQLLIGSEMDINFIPDALVNIPLTTNQMDSEEQFQNINLEIYAQKIEKINKQISELQKAVNYLYNENKAIKDINFNLTEQLFTKIYNQDNQLEQRTLHLNYEFTKKANQKLEDENEKLKDKIQLMEIEYNQQKVKIQKLELQKKTQDKEQLKNMIIFDNNVLDDSQLGESIKIDTQEKEVSQPQTANTSKVSQKSTKILPKPTARKTVADLNQSKIDELKKNIQQPTQTAKKGVKKTESQSTFIKSEIKKK